MSAETTLGSAGLTACATTQLNSKYMTIRRDTITDADLDTIVRHRRAMFSDMGYTDRAALDAMAGAFRPWLLQKMKAGEYLTWFAIVGDNSVAAGLGLWLMDWPPHMLGKGSHWRGNILNVYTELVHRRQGIARRLMETAMAWCETNEVGTVILHASPDGRQLYESLGFEPTNEMRLNR